MNAVARTFLLPAGLIKNLFNPYKYNLRNQSFAFEKHFNKFAQDYQSEQRDMKGK